MNDYNFILPVIEFFIERRCTPHWSIDESIIDFHDLTYVVSGKALYHINHIPIEMKAGDLLYTPPGTLRSAETDPHDLMIMYSINFNWLYQEELLLPFNTKTHIPWKAEVKLLYNKLNQIWKEQNAGYILESRSIFCLILSNLLKEYYSTGPEKSEQCMHIRKVKDYIAKHYEDCEISVSNLAEIVSITPNYLSTLFKKQEKTSIKAYLNQIRVQHAMDLIMTENTPIYEIAEQCGFKDVYYFSKVFKSFYGVPPTKMRK